MNKEERREGLEFLQSLQRERTPHKLAQSLRSILEKKTAGELSALLLPAYVTALVVMGLGGAGKRVELTELQQLAAELARLESRQED
jgi:hypothetical protein